MVAAPASTQTQLYTATTTTPIFGSWSVSKQPIIIVLICLPALMSILQWSIKRICICSVVSQMVIGLTASINSTLKLESGNHLLSHRVTPNQVLGLATLPLFPQKKIELSCTYLVERITMTINSTTCGDCPLTQKLGRLSTSIKLRTNQFQLAVSVIQAPSTTVTQSFSVESLKLQKNSTTATFSTCRREFGSNFAVRPWMTTTPKAGSLQS